jgi:hypothetical protein
MAYLVTFGAEDNQSQQSLSVILTYSTSSMPIAQGFFYDSIAP